MKQVIALNPYDKLCANMLINQIDKVVKQSYNKWKIGIAGNGVPDTERHINVTMFNIHNEDAILAAYHYFKEQGMIAKPVTDTDAKYLYLYKTGGPKLPENIL
jgi:hypothetical protein